MGGEERIGRNERDWDVRKDGQQAQATLRKTFAIKQSRVRARGGISNTGATRACCVCCCRGLSSREETLGYRRGRNREAKPLLFSPFHRQAATCVRRAGGQQVAVAVGRYSGSVPLASVLSGR